MSAKVSLWIARALLVIAALLGGYDGVLAQSTKAQLNTEIDTQFPDNAAGQITASRLRTVTKDMVNSVMPTAPVTDSDPAIYDGTTGLLKSGTRSGNTTVFGTTSGTLTSGNCVKFDASGNLVDNGSPCGGGGGGTPGGSNTQLQYNNAGSFGGISGATSNGTSVTLTSPTFVTPALGTPASGTLTNTTGLPISTGVSGLGTGVATFLGTPSSANLRSALTDETGTGAAVFADTPTLVTPVLGVATATSINKVAVTAPATSATLTIANGKTLTANNSITLAGTDSTTMTFPSASATITQTIASGAKALATGAISSATCTSAQTDTATGTATTDTIIATFNGDPTAVTGYVPLTTGMLTIIAYPTANTVNFKVCNNTSSSITPGAITLNWRVVR